MDTLTFVYTNGRGETNTYTVKPWAEEGHYITGTTSDGYRTFRKDRVKEYITPVEFLAEPYSPPPPRVKKDNKPSILFTGFPRVQRAVLEEKASGAGLDVKKSVTKALDFLVCGPTAGPAKVKKSREQGVYIVSQDQFFVLVDTGELVDD